MTAIYFDARVPDDVRRARLYQGQLFVYSPLRSATALCQLAREMLEQAFAPLDPRDAQFTMPVEAFASVLAEVKPDFIHHPRAKALIQEILGELGCNLEKTYFDVPRLRSMTHGDYLTAGIAYAFHPHRDTWYSAAPSQLNWWLPVYELESENAMAFHPRYWDQPVRNGSSRYNYDEWVRQNRFNAAQYIKEDTREQPRAEEPIELDPQIRVVCNVGGLILFSGAQLHSTVPNTSGRTRYSIDFRTVHLDDVIAKTGAPNVDSASTGTALRDFLRGTDLTRLPEPVVAPYDGAPPLKGEVMDLPPQRRRSG